MATAGKPSPLDERRAQFERYKEDVKKRGKPFYPYAMFHDTVMSLVVVSVIVGLATIWKWTSFAPHHDGLHQGLLGPEYTAPADPGTTSFVPRPDWYFYFLFYLLRIFKWPETVFLGTVGVPNILLVLLLALPFIDVRRERRLSRRPVAVVAAVLTILSMAVLTWKGATAKEALASEVIAEVPSWVKAEKLPPAAVPGAKLFAARAAPRAIRISAPAAQLGAPDLTGDRHTPPRRRFPDPPSEVSVVRESRLADAEVRLAGRQNPAPAGHLPRSIQGQAVTTVAGVRPQHLRRAQSRGMHVFLGITGASGAPYAARLLEALAAADCEIGVAASSAGIEVLATELYGNARLSRDETIARLLEHAPNATVYDPNDWKAPYASGSAKVDAYVICPCSMGTLGTIASGAMQNLIHRAASVALKEERRLVLMPRETPLSAIHLRNMLTLREAGATILFLAPGFYHGAETVDDLVDFIVARALDQLGLDNALAKRWGQ